MARDDPATAGRLPAGSGPARAKPHDDGVLLRGWAGTLLDLYDELACALPSRHERSVALAPHPLRRDEGGEQRDPDQHTDAAESGAAGQQQAERWRGDGEQQPGATRRVGERGTQRGPRGEGDGNGRDGVRHDNPERKETMGYRRLRPIVAAAGGEVRNRRLCMRNKGARIRRCDHSSS